MLLENAQILRFCVSAQSVPSQHQSNPDGCGRGRRSGVETWRMSGWQLTRHGTLAHDDGARESSHEVSLGDQVVRQAFGWMGVGGVGHSHLALGS